MEKSSSEGKGELKISLGISLRLICLLRQKQVTALFVQGSEKVVATGSTFSLLLCTPPFQKDGRQHSGLRGSSLHLSFPQFQTLHKNVRDLKG